MYKYCVGREQLRSVSKGDGTKPQLTRLHQRGEGWTRHQLTQVVYLSMGNLCGFITQLLNFNIRIKYHLYQIKFKLLITMAGAS